MDLNQLLNVKVSSKRFDESYKDSPYSISVIDAAQIKSLHIDNIYDLTYFIPNFSFRHSFGRWEAKPVMRGVSSALGEPATGLLIDGLSSAEISAIMPLFDLQQVKVLRGPENALFGRSTFSGAVNFISTKPSLNDYTKTAVTLYNDNGATIHQWVCNSADNKQLWSLHDQGNGYFEIHNKVSGKCVDVAGQSTAAGAQTKLWNCFGGDNQKFKFVP